MTSETELYEKYLSIAEKMPKLSEDAKVQWVENKVSTELAKIEKKAQDEVDRAGIVGAARGRSGAVTLYGLNV